MVLNATAVKARLGSVVRQAQTGLPSDVAGPKNLGLHIPPKPAALLGLVRYTIWVDEHGATRCGRTSGLMQSSVGDGDGL